MLDEEKTNEPIHYIAILSHDGWEKDIMATSWKRNLFPFLKNHLILHPKSGILSWRVSQWRNPYRP